jgi:hypothetical protein
MSLLDFRSSHAGPCLPRIIGLLAWKKTGGHRTRAAVFIDCDKNEFSRGHFDPVPLALAERPDVDVKSDRGLAHPLYISVAADGVASLYRLHKRDVREAGGGLLVAVVQLAIALGATAGGWMFDASGYQATFSLSAGISFVAGLLALAAWHGGVKASSIARSVSRRQQHPKGEDMARIFITGSTDGLGRAAARSLLTAGHGFTGRTWNYCLLRDDPALGESFRAEGRGRLEQTKTKTACNLASR